MVVSGMLMVDSVMVPLVVSFNLNGIGRASSKSATLYEALSMRLRVLGAVRSAVMKVGPEQKQAGTSLEVTSTTHANVLVTL